MKRVILAALVAGAVAVPAYPQTAAAPGAAQEPIPLPAEAPGGSITPGSVAAGSAAGTVILLLGIALVAVAFSSLGS